MTKKQEENIIKRIAKEITKEFPELKTKYVYDKIDDGWHIYFDKNIDKNNFYDYLDEKTNEIEEQGIEISIVYMAHKFRKELVEA